MICIYQALSRVRIYAKRFPQVNSFNPYNTRRGRFYYPHVTYKETKAGSDGPKAPNNK